MKELNLKSLWIQKKKGDLYYCHKCREDLEKDKFHNSKASKYGITSYCKSCDKIKRRIEFEKRALAEVLGVQRTKEELNRDKFKKCNKCGETKSIEEFRF
ncbi:hypothetical protein P6N96_02295 [Clostridium perfringens]|nr:hypothetical protein [Clostridium perfringens]